MRKFSKAEYEILAKRFNSKTILGKLAIVKANADVFRLLCDSEGRITLRLMDDDSNRLELDLLFDLPSNILEHPEGIKALFELANIPLNK